jgi:outer membrane lipoprotein SlyB
MSTAHTTMRGKPAADRRPAILYPLMVIAAIAVIIFSVAGIATMMGWLPTVHSQGESTAQNESAAQNEPATQGASGARFAPDRPRMTTSAAAACADCGVVESIRTVESKGHGSGLGAIGGALVGGVLGNQVGRGSGRTAATVVGAGAGAYAGNEIEKNTKTSVSYQVRVRMNDGSIRTLYERSQPALTIGQKVRVNGSEIVAAG